MASNLLFLGSLLLHPLLWVASSSFDDPSRSNEQTHEYLRFADVERYCQPVLSSATELPDDAYRASRVIRELPFENGDWRQDAGHAALMPFDGSDGRDLLLDPLYLATFVITHFDDDGNHRARTTTAVNVSGALVLSITRKSDDDGDLEIRRRPIEASPEFKLLPGGTKLKITFEGVYTENGDGDRVLCMVGSAVLPTRSTGSGGAHPWNWAKNSGRSGFVPPVTADDGILLVLRYPKELSLTTRAVLGEMRSTSAASYFDPVHLVSQLRWSSYKYRSDDLVAGAWDPFPSIADSRAAGQRYNGSLFCVVLKQYAGYGLEGVVTALPNRQCSSNSSTATDASSSCRVLGPFEMDLPVVDEDDISRVSIMMQDLQCYQDSAGTVRVSVVFRAISPWEDLATASRRSGIGGTTLFAEGVWVPSSGQACLVACRGIGDKACHFRVCLYMPMTFSITARGVLLGRITSINNARAGDGEVAHGLLSFSVGLSLPKFWVSDGAGLEFAYNYTKVKLAGELLRRRQPSSTVNEIVAKSFPLRYPTADHYVGDDKRSLAYLGDMLTLRFTTMPSMFRRERTEPSALHLEIIFVGQVSDRYTSSRHNGGTAATSSGMTAGEGLVLNVSGELTSMSHFQRTRSVMALEGVYSPRDGRMHLIGCRDLRWRRNTSTTTAGKDLDLDLEKGNNDCSIEVQVQYPPTNTHWLIWPWTAKVQIASTRSAGDPLHFDTVRLRALPLAYPQVWQGNLNGGLANGVLCIVQLSAVIAATLSQMRHIKSHGYVAPYVSLVMLGAKAIGFGAPLVTGIDALRARFTFTLGSEMADSALVMSRAYRSMDKAVKVLSLAALVFTLRLCQRVWRSRAPERGRVPVGEAKVFVYQCAVHVALFVLIQALDGRAFSMAVEQHLRLITQDLFLLPQVIGNAVWRVDCEPLAKSYYLGVTAARLLPHVFDYVRTPLVIGYSVEPLNGARFMLSNAGDVVIPAVSVLLVLVVYVQQRWNYAKVSTQ